jgi:hypothetical protein
MSTTMPSASSSRRFDDVGGSVQLLRRAEHFAVEAVRDHEVVADADAEHGVDSAQ